MSMDDLGSIHVLLQYCNHVIEYTKDELYTSVGGCMGQVHATEVAHQTSKDGLL